MKKIIIKTFLLTILSIFSVSFLAFLGSSGTAGEILANDIAELDQREEQRENDFLGQLLLDIPTLTDNPSHIITFVDPSDDNEGVQLKINESAFEQIRSPYTLPALAIGRHDLQFRFVDKYGSTQILEKDIVIIPRPPIINTPVFQENILQIQGSGLANSELILMLASDRDITVQETTIDGEGNWQLQIDTQELNEGIYTFTAYTRRYGYASNLAETITFEIGTSERIIVNNGNEISFSFQDISLENIPNILAENIDLGLLVGGSFIIGFFISLVIFSLVKSSADRRSVKLFEKKIKENNGVQEKELTLKERLSKATDGGEAQEEEKGEKEKEKEKDSKKKDKKKSKKNKKGKKKKDKKEKKEPKKKTEKILQKVDFLKDYKKFDPDDDQGNERDNIEVKVTSKK